MFNIDLEPQKLLALFMLAQRFNFSVTTSAFVDLCLNSVSGFRKLGEKCQCQ